MRSYLFRHGVDGARHIEADYHRPGIERMRGKAATAAAGLKNAPVGQQRAPLRHLMETLCRNTKTAMLVVLGRGMAVPLKTEIRRVAFCLDESGNPASDGVVDAAYWLTQLTIDDLVPFASVASGNLQRSTVQRINQQLNVSFSQGEMTGP
jgi:hypothetical protein